LLGEHVPYAIEARPEGNQRHLSAESGLYCRIITEGMFGFRPIAHRAFTITPRLPKDWDKMELENIWACSTYPFSIKVERLSKKSLQICIIANGEILRKIKSKDGENIKIIMK